MFLDGVRGGVFNGNFQVSLTFCRSPGPGGINTKTISLSRLFVAGVVAVIVHLYSGVGVAQTPQSCPLVCRGSANLPIGTAPGEGNFGFVFTQGTKPASQGLAPGECSWVDRGMYPQEPDRRSQHVEPNSPSL